MSSYLHLVKTVNNTTTSTLQHDSNSAHERCGTTFFSIEPLNHSSWSFLWEKTGFFVCLRKNIYPFDITQQERTWIFCGVRIHENVLKTTHSPDIFIQFQSTNHNFYNRKLSLFEIESKNPRVWSYFVNRNFFS